MGVGSWLVGGRLVGWLLVVGCGSYDRASTYLIVYTQDSGVLSVFYLAICSISAGLP